MDPEQPQSLSSFEQAARAYFQEPDEADLNPQPAQPAQAVQPIQAVVNDQSPQTQAPPTEPQIIESKIQNEATTEAGSDHASAEETRQALDEAIHGSNDVLVKGTTIFTLFPDTIIVDREKLTICRRSWFRSAEKMSMNIEDIMNATATVGPFTGSVNIKSSVFSSEHQTYTVGQFWRKDAIRIKRILQGYIIAMHKEIDCSALPRRELIYKLDKLGEDDHS